MASKPPIKLSSQGRASSFLAPEPGLNRLKFQKKELLVQEKKLFFLKFLFVLEDVKASVIAAYLAGVSINLYLLGIVLDKRNIGHIESYTIS